MLVGSGSTTGAITSGGRNAAGTSLDTTEIWGGSSYPTTTASSQIRAGHAGCGTRSNALICGGLSQALFLIWILLKFGIQIIAFLVLQTPPTPRRVQFKCAQSDGGKKDIVWPSNVYFKSGEASLSTADGRVDLQIYFDGTSYFIAVQQNYT